MKRNSLLFGLMALMAFMMSACKDKAIYKNFEFEYSFKAVVPSNALISSPFFPLSFEENSNSESQYAINDTRKDLVEEVYLNSFLLEVEEPSNEDLSFLNSASFYINAEDEPEMLVAYKDPVPSDPGNAIYMDLQEVNLAPYIRKDPFSIRSKVVTDENRIQDITLRGTVNFRVKAKVIDFN